MPCCWLSRPPAALVGDFEKRPGEIAAKKRPFAA
jgi:hypothetical protein